jgi:hypothetical protein
MDGPTAAVLIVVFTGIGFICGFWAGWTAGE